MLNIPSSFSRKPRSWKERARFKANEYRDVLFIGSFVLKQVLTVQDYSLWMLLVSVGLAITKDTVLQGDIASLEKECPLLVRSLRSRFGDSFMVYNIHQILHFPRYVRLLGNMTKYCTFVYEDSIGGLMSTVKGFYNGCREIARTLMLEDTIDLLSQKIDPNSTDKKVLHLLDQGSRTVYRTDAFRFNGFSLFHRLKSLNDLRERDIAMWTSLYLYVESREKITQPGNLQGYCYESASVHKFTISTKASRSDKFANSTIHIHGTVVRVLHIANVDDESTFIICLKSKIVAQKPDGVSWHLPMLLRIEWTKEIVCYNLVEFSGFALGYPELEDNSISITAYLLPMMLYQVD